LSLRYSYINLDNADLTDGIMSNITAGINWYLNPATKVVFNYIYTDIKNWESQYFSDEVSGSILA